MLTFTSSKSAIPSASFQSWSRWYGAVVAKLPLIVHAGWVTPFTQICPPPVAVPVKRSSTVIQVPTGATPLAVTPLLWPAPLKM